MWSNAGTYDLRIQAKDTYEDISDWSDPLVVTIDPPEPKLVIISNHHLKLHDLDESLVFQTPGFSEEDEPEVFKE